MEKIPISGASMSRHEPLFGYIYQKSTEKRIQALKG